MASYYYQSENPIYYCNYHDSYGININAGLYNLSSNICSSLANYTEEKIMAMFK